MLCQAYFSVSLIAPADSLMSSGAFLKYRAEHGYIPRLQRVSLLRLLFLKYRAEHGYIQLHVICIRFRPRNSLFLSHSNPESGVTGRFGKLTDRNSLFLSHSNPERANRFILYFTALYKYLDPRYNPQAPASYPI